MGIPGQSIQKLLENWNPEGELKYELSFEVETPSNNVIKGLHFRAYATLRQQWRMLVKASLAGQPVHPPLKYCFLVITRESAGSLDWDNAYGGLKPMLDCLVKASARNPDGLNLISDDNVKSMPFPPFFRQMPAKVEQGRTTVQIYELTPHKPA